MSKRYPGNFITGNPVTLSQTSNNGIWDVKDVSTAVDAGNWQEPDGIYEIARSLRFKNAAATSLSKTPIAAGNRKTWTWSAWVKRSRIGSFNSLFSVSNGGGGGDEIGFRDTDVLQFATSGGTQTWLVTSQVFRDVSAWYHIVCSIDTTQAAASNRAKIYVNGVQITALGTNTQPALNADTAYFNTASSHIIGSGYTAFDGYMAEVNFVDGQALDASYFGYTDSITGIWQPKKYTGGYGTNGFYLPFNNPSTTASLGWDYVQNQAPKFTFAQGSGMTFQSSIAKFGGSSMSFDGASGSGQSLSGNTQYAIGTGQFCIEAWIYPLNGHQNASGNASSTIISQGNNANNVLWHLGCADVTGSSTATRLTWGFTGATTITTATISIGAWHHVMVSRDASNVERIFMDGVLVNQRTNTTNYNNVSAYNTNIGFMYDTNYPGAYGMSSYGNVFKGYMNDLRLTIGAIPVPYQTSSVTVGTTIFTPPTAALAIGPESITDPRYWNNVAFHIPFNGSGTVAFPVYAKGSFTSNNFSVTAGVNYDSMVDSPTNVFTSATDVGGVVSGNYCTINAIGSSAQAIYTVSNAGLTCSSGASTGNAGRMCSLATWALPKGKFYWEMVAADGNTNFGILSYKDQGNDYATANSGGTFRVGVVTSTVDNYNYAAATYSGTAWSHTTNDVVGFAYDGTTTPATLSVYKNGTYFGAFTGIDPTLSWFPASYPSTGAASTTYNANFGQRAFAYTPPSGFKSLNTTNLQAMGTTAVGKAAIQPFKWFEPTLYAGTGGSRDVTTAGGFSPDLVWLKSRNVTGDNYIWDTVRGGGSNADLITNRTAAEGYNSAYHNFSFIPNGFNITQISPGNEVNYAGNSYVAWQWKQAPTSGFNIVTYSGDNVNGRSITHNLGITPSFIITKARTGSTYDWRVYHKSLTSGYNIALNTAAAEYQGSAGNAGYISGASSSTFSLSQSGAAGLAAVNSSGIDYVSYLWAEVPGFSKFGSYVGNGAADGPFINCGFRPRWIMIKTTTSFNWWVLDSVRDTYNLAFKPMIVDSNSTEYDGTTFASVDILSNGFKLKNTHQHTNYAGYNYIFAAFAESPFALNNRAR